MSSSFATLLSQLLVAALSFLHLESQQLLQIEPHVSLDLSTGQSNPDAEFTTRTIDHFVVRMSDGRLVVSDRDHLKIFSRDGKYAQRLGREGQGPGEFMHIHTVCVVRGDTIVAIDLADRLVVFSAAGAHVRTISSQRGSFVHNSCFRDGSVLVRSSRPDAAASTARGGGYVGQVAEIRRVGLDGREIGTIGTFPDGVAASLIPSVGNFVAADDRVIVGNGRKPEVAVFSLTGLPLYTFKWEQKAIAVTDSVLESAVRSGIPPSRASRSEVESRLALARSRRATMPPELPMYDRIRVDGNGRVWVQGYHLSSPGPRPWMVFDAAGRLLATVTAPALPGASRVTIQSFVGNEVVMRWTDQNGFIHLSLHALSIRR